MAPKCDQTVTFSQSQGFSPERRIQLHMEVAQYFDYYLFNNTAPSLLISINCHITFFFFSIMTAARQCQC